MATNVILVLIQNLALSEVAQSKIGNQETAIISRSPFPTHDENIGWLDIMMPPIYNKH